MAKGRRLSLEIPKYLLDQIEQRSRVNSRTRNAEFRYLVDIGLRYAGEADFKLDIPGRTSVEWVQIPCYLDREVLQVIRERAAEFHRGVGYEVIRLAVHAIEEGTRRDLEVIEAMMRRRDQGSPSAPQTAAT